MVGDRKVSPFKGQGRVCPVLRVPMVPWYLLCSLGILGDYKPITHKYPLYWAEKGISHKGYVGRGSFQLSPDPWDLFTKNTHIHNSQCVI